MLKGIKMISDKFYQQDYIIFPVQFLKLIFFLGQFHMWPWMDLFFFFLSTLLQSMSFQSWNVTCGAVFTSWPWLCKLFVLRIFTWSYIRVQLAGAVKYADCISPEGIRPSSNTYPGYDTKPSDGPGVWGNVEYPFIVKFPTIFPMFPINYLFTNHI